MWKYGKKVTPITGLGFLGNERVNLFSLFQHNSVVDIKQIYMLMRRIVIYRITFFFQKYLFKVTYLLKRNLCLCM